MEKHLGYSLLVLLFYGFYSPKRHRIVAAIRHLFVSSYLFSFIFKFFGHERIFRVIVICILIFDVIYFLIYIFYPNIMHKK